MRSEISPLLALGLVLGVRRAGGSCRSCQDPAAITDLQGLAGVIREAGLLAWATAGHGLCLRDSCLSAQVLLVFQENLETQMACDTTPFQNVNCSFRIQTNLRGPGGPFYRPDSDLQSEVRGSVVECTQVAARTSPGWNEGQEGLLTGPCFHSSCDQKLGGCPFTGSSCLC